MKMTITEEDKQKFYELLKEAYQLKEYKDRAIRDSMERLLYLLYDKDILTFDEYENCLHTFHEEKQRRVNKNE